MTDDELKESTEDVSEHAGELMQIDAEITELMGSETYRNPWTRRVAGEQLKALYKKRDELGAGQSVYGLSPRCWGESIIASE